MYFSHRTLVSKLYAMWYKPQKQLTWGRLKLCYKQAAKKCTCYSATKPLKEEGKREDGKKEDLN